MSASLPMYWRADNAAIWQRFWHHVQTAARASSIELPDLTPPEALPDPLYDHWLSPDLVLSQTCGLPLRTRLKNKVTYVVTPDFAIQGCAPGHYHSVVLRRKGSDTGWRLARNASDSQSGWATAVHWQQKSGPERWDAIIDTGAHAASAAYVASGKADVACVDAVTWRLIQSDPDLSDLEVIDTTPPTPALPIITATDRDPAPLRRALEQALPLLSEGDRKALGGLHGFVTLSVDDYFRIPVPPDN